MILYIIVKIYNQHKEVIKIKKILFTANTDRHILLCHLPFLRLLKNKNFNITVVTGTNMEIEGFHKVKIKMTRNPFRFSNFNAIFKLKQLLEKENYAIIHTHTPVASVVTRLAVKFSKCKPKVIYTCHGFHFFKGCPLYFWIFFYPIEKYLMKYTDALLVMNKEDYEFSKKHFKNTKIYYINGAGFQKERLEKKYNKKELEEIYIKNDISKDDFVVIYIAEFSKRKGQVRLVKELAKTSIKNSNIKILLIGDDSLNGKLQKKIKKYQLEKTVKVIHFTNEISKYLDIAKLVISVSNQEGLPMNIMEAIYKKKIVIATNCRGNIDLIKDNVNGFLIKNIKELYPKIQYVQKNYYELSKSYQQGININKYSSEKIIKDLEEIYNQLI